MFLGTEKIINEAKNLLNNKFGKRVAIITGGATVAYIISIISSPIITRLYSPEELGILAVFTSIVYILTVIASLKYEWAIPIAKTDKSALNIVVSCFLILVFYIFLITGVFFLFGDSLFLFLNTEELLGFKYLVPLGVFLLGSYQVLMQWAFRKKIFKRITGSQITHSVGQNTSKIGFGYIGWGPLGLLVAWIIGETIAILILFINLLRTVKEYVKEISFRGVIHSVKRYIDFPLYSAPGQFLNTLGIQLPALIMTSIYGSDIVGFFVLANSVTNLPMSLIGKAVGDVFYSEAASLGKEDPERLLELSRKLQKKLILIAIPPLLVLLFGGPFLFSIIFGPEWEEAGKYASIMTILVFSRFVFTPISKVFSIFERQKKGFFTDLLRVVMTLVAFGSAALFTLKPSVTVLLYSILIAIVYFVIFFMAQKIMKSEVENKRRVKTD